MIAMALACDPAIVIGDEPTTALDVMVQAQILQLLEDLRGQARAVAHPHHPRPVGHRRDVRPGDGHVRRPGGGGRPGVGGLHPAAPPVHAEAAGGLPEHPRRPPDARGHPGLAAGPARSAARLPVRAALLVRDGCLLGGGAARRDVRRRAGSPATCSRPAATAAGVAGPPRDGTLRRDAARAVCRAPAGAPIIELTDLTVHFPIYGGLLDVVRRRPRGVVRAVDGIDLTLMQGEVLALVGESGSGKTTTGRVIVKLTRQTTGRIDFEGTDVSALWSQKELRHYRRRVQLIFQDPYETLDPKQTIRDFVAEPLVVNRIGTPRRARGEGHRRARIGGAAPGRRLRRAVPARAVRRTAPARRHRRRARHGPGGHRRRRARVDARRVDPDRAAPAHARPARERGLTYLFITHDLSLAWVIADRIAVMYLGKIMEIGPAEAVIRSPRNPYTQALVSVSPSPDPPDAGTRAKRTILEGETPDAAHVPTGCRFHPRCPVAFDRCRVEEPPLFDVGGGQSAACWLAEPGQAECRTSGRIAASEVPA